MEDCKQTHYEYLHCLITTKVKQKKTEVLAVLITADASFLFLITTQGVFFDTIKYH